jgi:hypothetical protein
LKGIPLAALHPHALTPVGHTGRGFLMEADVFL